MSDRDIFRAITRNSPEPDMGPSALLLRRPKLANAFETDYRVHAYGYTISEYNSVQDDDLRLFMSNLCDDVEKEFREKDQLPAGAIQSFISYDDIKKLDPIVVAPPSNPFWLDSRDFSTDKMKSETEGGAGEPMEG
ncbi:hypothetical protein HDU99_001562, partial [Rhizoclosmatium hyalinum]